MLITSSHEGRKATMHHGLAVLEGYEGVYLPRFEIPALKGTLYSSHLILLLLEVLECFWVQIFLIKKSIKRIKGTPN